MARPPRSPTKVFAVTELFLRLRSEVSDEGSDKYQSQEIVNIINRELKYMGVSITKETMYDYISDSFKRGYLALQPPVSEVYRRKLCDHFKMDDRPKSAIRVIDCESKDRPNRIVEQVTQKGSQLVYELIKKLALNKSGRVGIGLGPGRTNLLFCEYLSKILNNDRTLRVKLFACTPSTLVRESRYAPTSFFNLFKGDVETVGIFGETLIQSDSFERVKVNPGLRIAFQERGEIDIVVATLGNFYDEHNLLTSMFAESNHGVEELKASGAIGSILYRPYGKNGMIDEPSGSKRAISLFEINELAEFIKLKNKHVVVIAHPCRECKSLLTDANVVRPLFESVNLKIWSHLIMDVYTAKELLNEK